MEAFSLTLPPPPSEPVYYNGDRLEQQVNFLHKFGNLQSQLLAPILKPQTLQYGKRTSNNAANARVGPSVRFFVNNDLITPDAARMLSPRVQPREGAKHLKEDGLHPHLGRKCFLALLFLMLSKHFITPHAARWLRGGVQRFLNPKP